MAEKNRTQYQGLALPDTRASVWAAESSYTQAGPTPGIPVADNSTNMVLQSSGTQSASKSLDIRSSKGGLVTGDEGARYIWKNTTDSSSSYRGWDAPSVLTSFESVRWTDASGVLKYTTEPDAVTLANQVVLVAYASRDTSRSSGEYGVEVSIRATAGTWSNVTVFATSFATPANQLRSPCLVVLPSGRVLCLFWILTMLVVLTSGNITVMTAAQTGHWEHRTACVPMSSTAQRAQHIESRDCAAHIQMGSCY